MRHVALSSTVLALICAGACSHSDKDPLPTSADSGFTLERDAFRFENFAEGYEAAVMTPELAVRMFGEANVCRTGADDCVPTADAQAWIDTANAAMDAGRCEGFAVLSQLFFLERLDPTSFGADTAADLTLDENYALQRELAYWFSTQLVPGAVENRALMPREAVRFMAEFLKPGAKEFYRIGMVQRTAAGFGDAHSLTPVGFARGETSNIYYVRVYDNNFPDVERQLKLDVAANTWEYRGVTTAGEEVYAGGEAAQNPLYFAPTAAREGTLPCPFCADTGTRTITVEGVTPLVTDGDGNRVGFQDGKLVEEGGGSVKPGFAACAGDGATLQLTAKASADMPLEIAVSGADSKRQSVTVQGGRLGTVRVAGELSNSEKAGQIQVTPDTVSVQPSGGTTQVTFSVGKSTVTLDVSGDAGNVTVARDPDTGALKVTTDGAEGAKVTVTLVDNSDPYNDKKPSTSYTVTGSEGASELSIAVPKDGYQGGVPEANVTADGMTSQVSGLHCGDSTKNEDETDVDCGGSVCGACARNRACQMDRDCAVGACASSTASAPSTCVDTCADGRKDGDETDVDCGGSCQRRFELGCGAGKMCTTTEDCTLGVTGRIFEGSVGKADYVAEPPAHCRETTCVSTPRIGGKVDLAGGLAGLGIRLSSGGREQTVWPGVFATDFFFPDADVSGDYTVSIATQPEGGSCSITQGASGALGSSLWVDDIRVVCVAGRDTCKNGRKDLDETDVDCGGNQCRPWGYYCTAGKACAVDTDCGSPSFARLCVEGTCKRSYSFSGTAYTTVPVTVELTPGGDLSGPSATPRQKTLSVWGDQRLELTQTRVVGAYGLSVVPQTGVTCNFSGLPASPITVDNDWVRGFSLKCTSCGNGAKEAFETDVDCGGRDCNAESRKCGQGKACRSDGDCASNLCMNGACTLALCENGAKDSGETDVDCGGSCVAQGKKCDLTEGCSAGTDCTSAICDAASHACVSCGDGTKNGVETGTDCGGSDCVAAGKTCGLTVGCAADTDCGSAICDDAAHTCVSCTDGVKNGAETALDCGGADCRATRKCALGAACTVASDCVTGATCSDGLCAEGKSWSVVAQTTFSASKVEDASAVAGDDVWVSGDDALAHYTGTWSSQQPLGAGSPITGMFARDDGTGFSEVWVLSDDNIVKHWNGADWFLSTISFTGSPIAKLNDIHGAGGLVLIVGGEGQVARLDVNTGDFTSEFGGGGVPGGLPGMPPPTSADLNAVFVLDDNHAWAVGAGGTIVTLDTGVWTKATSPSTAVLRDVWAAAANDVWAVGDGGVILHYDGASWTQVSSGVTSDLASVWGATGSQVFMVGDAGVVLFWDGASIAAESAASTVDLGVVFGFDTTRWAMGTNTLLLERN